MKRTGWLLLGLALAGTGCLNLTPPRPEEGKVKPAEHPASLPPPPPATVVTPDQVTEANAAEKAQALRRELEEAAGEQPVPHKSSQKTEE